MAIHDDNPVGRALDALANGRQLGETVTMEAFGQVMRGAATPAQVGALLMGLRAREEGVDELTGAVRALRQAMVAVPVADRTHLIDTCGTGGGAVSTFNISTASALVAVGAGAAVAKHGNRSYTSKCGSADVLEALGIGISVDAERAAELLERVRMAFLFAPAFHPAMRHVAPIRRELGVPTLMNMIGPLANPAGVTRQLIGVADARHAPLMAAVLSRLDAEHALVVHAEVGMDEISPVGRTTVWEVRHQEVTTFAIDPETYGIARCDVQALAGGEPDVNANRVERLLNDSSADPSGRAAVGLNAGAAIYVAGLVDELREGIALAFETLDGGRGAEALARLRDEAGVSTS